MEGGYILLVCFSIATLVMRIHNLGEEAVLMTRLNQELRHRRISQARAPMGTLEETTMIWGFLSACLEK